MAGLLRLLRQKWNPPRETVESFSGKTVLITGTTSGLGLEAAKKLASLNATKLIITARSTQKGQQTKRQIEQHIRHHVSSNGATTAPSTEITVLELDMSSFSNVEKFITCLKQYLGNSNLDAAILNAGTLSQRYHRSVDGYEDTIQVNLLSTCLLAAHLVPLLLDTESRTGRPSHLTFVSSGLAHVVKLQSMVAYLNDPKPLQTLSSEKEFPAGAFGGQAQYGRSKLLLEYAMRHLASSSALVDSRTLKPRVIVNSVCPGMCKSDLGRSYSQNSFAARVAIVLMNFVFARTASQGANSYISALLLGESSRGQMWKDDKVYELGEMLRTSEGKAFGDIVWRETVEVVRKQVAGPTEVLDSAALTTQ